MAIIFSFAGENILFLPGYKLKKTRVSQKLDPGFAKTRPGYFFISPQEHFPFKGLKQTLSPSFNFGGKRAITKQWSPYMSFG